jgi:DNA/RNA endonuclease YhcR with UshA esterase domain
VSESKAAITITAVEFYGQYEQSETLANAKYINKVIEVTGTIAAIQTSDKSCSILLDAEQPTGAVNCVFSNEGKNRIMSLKKGQKMTVKGKCSGFLMDVNLVDCVMVNNID